MIRYELKQDSIEVKYKNRKEIKPGIVLSSDYQEPELIESFETKEEALEAIKNYKSSIRRLSNAGMTYYLVEEYYIEENLYDDEDPDEWLECVNILDYSKMEIELVEKPSYNTLAVFDNMADAEEAEADYEGDGEVFLSF